MPSLSVDVDEFTLVLQPVDKVKTTEWPEVAEEMMSTFLTKSRLTDLFGSMSPAAKVQAGYTSGLTYTDRPWYLAICWNEDMPTMGVCVRFSAHAYSAFKQEFKERFQSDINIAVFLDMVQDDVYTTRISRIDLTADYYDYSDELLPCRQLSPDLIYERLKDGSYVVKNRNDRQSVRNMSALDREGRYETLYIGSRRGKTNGFLRVYDKKQEQIQTMGYRYDEALRYESGVRFVASYLHDYAHQITEELLKNVVTTQDLQQLIAKYISDRYRFVDTSTSEVTAFTDDLIGVAAGSKAAALSAASPRDNTLRQSIEHLRAGSGLYATLFKAYKIWGDESEKQLLQYLYDDYVYNFKVGLLTGKDKYKAKEIRLWLQRHEEETKKHPLDDYLDRSKHKLNLPLFDIVRNPIVITVDEDIFKGW